MDYRELNYKRKYFLLRRTLRKLMGALRDTHALLKSLLEHSGLGVFIVDQGGCFRFLNGEAASMTGYSAAELLRRHFRSLLTLDDLSDGFRLLYETMQGKLSAHNRFRMRRKDGSTMTVEVDMFPVVKRGMIQAGLGFVREICVDEGVLRVEREHIHRIRGLGDQVTSWELVVDGLTDEINRLKSAMSEADGSEGGFSHAA